MSEPWLHALAGQFDCHLCLASSVDTARLAGAELIVWAADEPPPRQPPCPLIMVARAGAFDGPPPGIDVTTVAWDFIVQPFEPGELLWRACRLLSSRSLAPSPGEAGNDSTGSGGRIESMIAGRSPALLRQVEKLNRYAACDAGVLVLGETGTGKEVFAQAIHHMSQRAGKPMVSINCGALPAELIESELFGHVKGAYTHAHMARAGLVAEAEGGTLFLDDVDCLPLAAQAKLLRLLQEREYRVVGSNTVRHANVRVIAASNRDLEAASQRGRFRADLFYRLNVLSLTLPPLRERLDDIPLLAAHFLCHFALRHQRPACTLTFGALQKLAAHDWPGNVRELGHLLERAMLLAGDTQITADNIDLPSVPNANAAESFQVLKARVIERFERTYIEGLLASTRGNIADAARRAGKNRRALFELIRKHRIAAASFREVAD